MMKLCDLLGYISCLFFLEANEFMPFALCCCLRTETSAIYALRHHVFRVLKGRGALDFVHDCIKNAFLMLVYPCSSQGLNLPESLFASPIVSGISTVI